MEHKRKTLIRSFIIASLAIGLTLSGLVFLHANSSKGDLKLGADKPPVVSVSPAIQQLNQAFIDVSKAVTPSVVRIEVVSTPKDQSTDNPNQDNPLFRFFGPDSFFHFNIPHPQNNVPQQGFGSGIIVTKDGYILTNNHVVDGADKKGITVRLADKSEYKGQVIGKDPETDLAVIKIDAKDLTPAALGNSDDVQVGQWVLAVGNPLGLNNTVTSGIVSALGRNIGIIRESNQYAIENFIQTDAAVNPGNSGGALVNLNGEVIGINAAIESRNGGFIGYAFAIPINLAKNVAIQLIENGKVERPYIGVQIQAIDKTMAKALGLDEVTGVIVQEVVKGSPAEPAGIEQGDVILKIDGKKLSEPNQLQVYVASKKPGDVVTLDIYRNSKHISKEVTLKARPQSEEIASTSSGNESESDGNAASVTIKSLGITVENLDAKTKKDFDVTNGVRITNAQPAGAAAARGVQVGEVVVDVDRKPVKSASEFNSIVQDHKSGDSMLLRLKDKDKTTRLVAIELP